MKIERVFFRGSVVKRRDFLEHPDKYPNVICINVRRDWWRPVVNYAKWNKDKLGDLAIKIEAWDVGFSDRAKRFYFAVRDRLAEAMGDTSREHKNHLHEEAKKECGIRNSLNDLNKRELWFLTEVMLRWAEEAGAYLDDLIPLYRSLNEKDKS